MKEYMKERRKDNKFKKKELERKNTYNKKYKNLNAEKIKESWQKASATYKETNPENVRKQLKEPLQNTEKQILKRLKNPLR